MTDKQIIIDGVDVSGCEFCDYKSSNIPQCRTRLASFEPICDGFSCYYKQLKCKEQECEELNKTITNLENIRDEFSVKLDQLKETNEGLLSIQYKLADSNLKLRQTLVEIKEIVEEQCNICETITPIDEYKDCKKCWQGVILQKINECEEGGEQG